MLQGTKSKRAGMTIVFSSIQNLTAEEIWMCVSHSTLVGQLYYLILSRRLSRLLHHVLLTSGWSYLDFMTFSSMLLDLNAPVQGEYHSFKSCTDFQGALGEVGIRGKAGGAPGGLHFYMYSFVHARVDANCTDMYFSVPCYLCTSPWVKLLFFLSLRNVKPS